MISILRSMLADTLWESANMTYDIYALHGKWNPVKKIFFFDFSKKLEIRLLM